MADYRYLYADALTDVVHGELPLESAEFTETLNSPGSFQGTMPLRPHRLGKVSPVNPEHMAPGRTKLYVERDGVILWGGLLWTLEMDVESNGLTLGGEGFLSYFRRRLIRATKTYAQQDQAYIAADLIDYAQALSYGNLSIRTDEVTATGVRRDRTYWYYERKNLGEALEQLAAVQDGFDFRFPSRYASGGYIETTFQVGYPATGRRTDHVFELGANVELLGLSVDATEMALQVDATGEGEGDDMLLTSVTDTTLLGAYPLLERVDSFGDVRVRATLEDHARRLLKRGSAPIRIPDLAVHSDTVPTPGAYVVGDVVRVRGSYGLLSLDARYRIIEVRVGVNANGSENVRLALAPWEVF
jgi:hypothetical protein